MRAAGRSPAAHRVRLPTTSGGRSRPRSRSSRVPAPLSSGSARTIRSCSCRRRRRGVIESPRCRRRSRLAACWRIASRLRIPSLRCRRVEARSLLQCPFRTRGATGCCFCRSTRTIVLVAEEVFMTTETIEPLGGVEARQRAASASRGDSGIATLIVAVAERAGRSRPTSRPGSEVLDVATGSRNATLAAAQGARPRFMGSTTSATLLGRGPEARAAAEGLTLDLREGEPEELPVP